MKTALRFPAMAILVSSLLWALCYPPFPLGLFGFAALAPAFLATTTLAPGRAFRLWFLGGLAYNAAMYWWIWHVMKVGPALVVGAGLVLLIAFLSLFNGFLGWAFACAWRVPRYRWGRAVLLATYPLMWAGLEAARAVGEMSFPWNNLAYTLGGHPALFQSVSVWGVYGLSAVMVTANLMLVRALMPAVSDHRAGHRAALALFVALPLLLALHGGLRLAAARDEEAPRLDIALVQPSIPQTKKWNEGYFNEVMGKTFRTMAGPQGDHAAVRDADLVVFAETAVPDFLRSRPELIDSLQALSTSLNVPLLVGALDIVGDKQPWREYRFFNSAFLFGPPTPYGPAHPRRYSKLRLVPFSEKLPFDGVFPVLNYVNLGEGDFSAGDGQRVWGEAATRWAPSICYEVIYPSFAREARAAGAMVLVNITNDGWFGRSNGPYQHANIARFRAAETGMPVARCANNGVSVFFDARGRDLGRTALMDSTVLRRSIAVPGLTTVYARFGGAVDAIFLAILAAWLVLLGAAARPTRTQGANARGGQAQGVH